MNYLDYPERSCYPEDYVSALDKFDDAQFLRELDLEINEILLQRHISS